MAEDKNMGGELPSLPEVASKFRIVKGGPRAQAVEAPLSIHRRLNQYLDTHPVIDKDSIEATLGSVEGHLIKTRGEEGADLVRRARSGEAFETTRAIAQIRETISPPQSPARVSRPELQVTGDKLSEDLPDEIRESQYNGAIGKLVKLFELSSRGLAKGLKHRDLISLLHRLREPEKRDATIHEVERISKPFEQTFGSYAERPKPKSS